MSRLEELIQEFCPDGVELRPLNAVCHYANNRIDVSQISKHTYVGVENLLQNKRGKSPQPLSRKQVLSLHLGKMIYL